MEDLNDIEEEENSKYIWGNSNDGLDLDKNEPYKIRSWRKYVENPIDKQPYIEILQSADPTSNTQAKIIIEYIKPFRKFTKPIPLQAIAGKETGESENKQIIARRKKRRQKAFKFDCTFIEQKLVLNHARKMVGNGIFIEDEQKPCLEEIDEKKAKERRQSGKKQFSVDE